MRWLLTFLLACVVFNLAREPLRRLGLGRLPGDFRFRAGGREWSVPLGSSVVFSLLAALIGLLL
jgi:Protein of unknown function (DUF2905)